MRLLTTARERFPELRQFLGGYLHQDFPEVHGDAESAIASAIEDSSAEQLEVVHAQLQGLIASSDEASAERAVRELCDYYPPFDGWTYLAWLHDVDRRVCGRT